jgi:hypothetical protein
MHVHPYGHPEDKYSEEGFKLVHRHTRFPKGIKTLIDSEHHSTEQVFVVY